MTKFFPDEYESVIESKAPIGSLYRRGRQFEYRVRDHLKGLGFFVLRSPASKSPIDLVAIRRNEVLFVQCKVGGTMAPDEWNKFLQVCQDAGAVPVLASRCVRAMSLFEITGHKDGSRRAQPMVPLALESQAEPAKQRRLFA